MAATNTVDIGVSWSLVVASTVTKFTIQVQSGLVAIQFADSMPSDIEGGLVIPIGQGVNRNFGDGNVYVKSISDGNEARAVVVTS